ncbi:hypothetical protein C8R43DRAFT_1124401 [Mycena crocata]|nr:hypothetical protein C8R43DRAFT_1124401 [Mycena crocata]
MSSDDETGSSGEDDSRTGSHEPPADKRRIDEDAQLEGLGTTTHRSRNRNRGLPVIPIRKHRRRSAGVNARASARKRQEGGFDKSQKLTVDLNDWAREREERAHELATKHSIKVAEVRRRMMSSSAYKPKRKVSLYNAKISRIMANLNEGLPLGERHKMPAVKRMVAEDPSMLEDFTAEEEEEMVEEVVEKRRTKLGGMRANNLAASADARRTMLRLYHEITRLAERCGMVGFAMFTRGHIHDRTVPMSIESWGALNFFREVLNRDPADVATLFELWALNQARGISGHQTLRDIQQECTAMITSGLQRILDITKVAMNYENYINALVLGKGVGLVGWPAGVAFKRMSKQSAIGPLRKLRDVLKDGTCHWKVLSEKEKRRLTAQFKEMVEEGEVVVKEKKSKKAGKKVKDAGAKRAEKRKRGAEVEQEDKEEQEEDEEDEDGVRKPVATMTVQERRAHLERLAAKAHKAHTAKALSKKKSKEAVPKKLKQKPTNAAPPRKKARRQAAVNSDDEEPTPQRGSKRKAALESENDEADSDSAPVAKKLKTHGTGAKAPAHSRATNARANPGVQPRRSPRKTTAKAGDGRPRPIPAYKGAPGATSLKAPPADSTSAAPAASTAPKNTVKGPKGGPPGKRVVT